MSVVHSEPREILYVYYLCCNAESDEYLHLKIGRSEQPFQRLTCLAHNCGIQVVNFGYMATGPRQRTNRIEHELHKAFHAWRLRGEWYKFHISDKPIFLRIRNAVLDRWRNSMYPMKLQTIDVDSWLKHQQEKQKSYQRRWTKWGWARQDFEYQKRN